MVELDVGRTGVAILVLLFLLLTAEDLLVWINAGSVPGIEFFLGAAVVLVVAFFAIRQARSHPPPRH
jgi:hypothetical protein